MLWGRTCPACDSCDAFGVSAGPARGIGGRKEYTYFTSCDPHHCTYILIYYSIYVYIFLHSIWQTSSRTFYLTYHTGHSICRCTWHHTRHSLGYSDLLTSSLLLWHLTFYVTLYLASYSTFSLIFSDILFDIFSDILFDVVLGIIPDILSHRIHVWYIC